jgi:hypothetical protein
MGKKHKGLIVATVCVVVVGIVIAVLAKQCGRDEVETLPMEGTMASIEEVKPRGELYVCSALIEDYTTQRAIEHNLLWEDDTHSCVQTMTQKCSYKIDLDRVEYEPVDSLRKVRVKLPPVEYVATTQSAAFLSDDSNFWAERLPNTNEMKRKVEEQIRRRFDTAKNRRKAEQFAEEAISEVMGKMGYEVEFVRGIEMKKN